MTTPPPVNFSERFQFHETDRIVEVDLTDLILSDSDEVNALYDALEHEMARWDRRWFLMVNYLRCQIHPEAWIAFANRGKKLNLTYSLGSVRFNTEQEMRALIERHAETAEFDANLAKNHDEAYAELCRMRDDYLKAHPEPRPVSPDLAEDFARRITFHETLDVLEVDFSEFAFDDSTMVDSFYDAIDARIAASGRDYWYFLANYKNCQVGPEAWVAFANRGKKVNLAHSLGTVRFDANSDTAGEIQKRATAQGFEDNLYPTREAALAEIARRRSDAAAD
jgi:hypothetical protein